MARIDWPGLMRAGIKGHGLRPDDFWALTPAELHLILGDPISSAPLGRGGLEALMRAYPDTPCGNNEDQIHDSL